jgi:hypothetical protein
MPLPLDLRLLWYFKRTAEIGSLTKAAAELRTSQPALTRHIMRLEHELRATLLLRRRSRFSALSRTSAPASVGVTPRWSCRPGDDLVVVIGVNSSVDANDDTIDSLYQAVLGILEPQSHEPMHDRQRNRRLESLQGAKDQGSMRPRAGERDIEVVASDLGLEATIAGRSGCPVGVTQLRNALSGRWNRPRLADVSNQRSVQWPSTRRPI